jgi:hypothetical protein
VEVPVRALLVDSGVGVAARTRFGAEQKLNYCPEGMVHTMNNLIFNCATPARPHPILAPEITPTSKS